MNKTNVEALVTELTTPVVEELGILLVDVEFVKEGPQRFLRVYIDKEEGINIDDCQKVSQVLSEKLDEIDPIEENYFLEVSSPGIDRPLKTEKDFNNALNEDVEVNLYKAVEGKKRHEGKLVKFNDNVVVICNEEVGELELERNIISKINLAIKF